MVDGRRLVVQLLGIRTDLQRVDGVVSMNQLQNLAPDAIFRDNTFDQLRARLIVEAGFHPDDFLWYSYRGGVVDESGRWMPEPYTCVDTAQDLRQSVKRLRAMLVALGEAHSGGEVVLLGHSQGGLIAFQVLAMLAEFEERIRVGTIITVDSPLGGSPALHVWPVALRTCWRGPANRQLIRLYRSSRNHRVQGSTARPLIGLLGAGPAATTNAALAATAATKTAVYTFGYREDGVYMPGVCSKGFGRVPFDNSSSQVVDGCFGGLASLPDELFPPLSFSSCVSARHRACFTLRVPDLVEAIGAQL